MKSGTRKIYCPNCRKTAYIAEFEPISEPQRKILEHLGRMTIKEQEATVARWMKDFIDRLMVEIRASNPLDFSEERLEGLRQEAYQLHGISSDVV